MRSILITIALTILSIVPAWAQYDSLVIKGTYQGKPLYVQNPFVREAGGFCIQQVLLNRFTLLNAPRASAVRIAPADAGLRVGDKVEIIILHHRGYMPKVLNPEVIIFAQPFSFVYTTAGEESLRWAAKGAASGGSFSIQRAEPDGWHELASKYAVPGIEEQAYEQSISHQPGENEYRILYTDNEGQEKESNPFLYTKNLPPVTFSPTRVSDQITLSRKAFFEILDEQGNQILKGEMDQIPLRRLRPGTYFIVLDGERNVFYKQ